jgi:hypothetical protein
MVNKKLFMTNKIFLTLIFLKYTHIITMYRYQLMNNSIELYVYSARNLTLGGIRTYAFLCSLEAMTTE